MQTEAPNRNRKAKRATHGVFFINSQLEHPIPADLHTLYIHRARTERRQGLGGQLERGTASAGRGMEETMIKRKEEEKSGAGEKKNDIYKRRKERSLRRKNVES